MVSLNVSSLKNKNNRIIGHVKKIPISSITTDHIYLSVDVNASDSSSNPLIEPTTNPTRVPTSKSMSEALELI